MQITISTESDLPRAAREFISAMGKHRIFAFTGDMGAGKTTFISALCRELGVSEEPSSPTFAIVNDYATLQGDSIYHFDFYRVDSPAEVADMGAEDYFYSGALCFIEWPEVARKFLPTDTVEVTVTSDATTGIRTIKL